MADGSSAETGMSPAVGTAKVEHANGTVARTPPVPVDAEAQRLLEVMDVSPNLVGTVDTRGRVIYLNRAGHTLLGLPWSDDPDQRITELGVETLHPPDMQDFYWRTIVPAVKRDGVWEGDTEVIDRFGERIPVNQLVVAHREPAREDGEPGRITHVSTIVRDMRERAALEQRLRAARLASERARDAAEMALAHAQNTAHEVNHRVKNLFALVPAIVQISARSTDDMRRLVEMVRERLAALSRSHELTLNERGELTGVSLRALMETVLEPYIGGCNGVALDGPSLHMNASDGNTLSLILHELATNAAKHGALSDPKGRLGVRWTIRDRSEPSEGENTETAFEPNREDDGRWTVLDLVWHEASCSKPLLPVRPPERVGSGTQLLDRLVAAQRGTVSRSWRAEGLELRLALPVHGARPARRRDPD